NQGGSNFLAVGGNRETDASARERQLEITRLAHLELVQVPEENPLESIDSDEGLVVRSEAETEQIALAVQTDTVLDGQGRLRSFIKQSLQAQLLDGFERCAGELFLQDLVHIPDLD